MDVDLHGRGFRFLPSDAIGVYSTRNGEPLYNRYSENLANIGNVVIDTGAKMSVVMDKVHSYGSAHYLGGIVSRDRETVYWVNETAPLPS